MTEEKLMVPPIHIPGLPDKLSDLLELAVGDLRKAVADGCKIRMHTIWHAPSAEGCWVCFAGAVMRRGLSDDEAGDPDRFDDDTRHKLRALNALRAGSFGVAFRLLGLTGPGASLLLRRLWYTRKDLREQEEKTFPYEYAEDNPTPFFNDLQLMIDELREINL